ncbi:unnamed protein product [Xylocopa violacea]|uniref:Uncharacterized protein n=1 Tax=Xylocopa violacea TaxID=135666 RepID=A0ABP1N9J9_XYLVO
MRDPLLWPNTHNFSKFHMKYNDQRNRQYKLKTFLQEKKKLLCPHENKIVTSNHVDLTKQLLLRLSFSSSSLAHARTKGASKPISNKWENINLENYKSNQLTIRSTKNRHPDSFKSNKDICFSDEDLKLLLISLSSEKSNTTKDGSLLHEWHAENVHYSRGQNNACSKLIELTYEDTNIFSNNTQKNRLSTSQSNCSPYSLLSNLAIDSKYFSDSMIKKPDIVPHMSINKLKRFPVMNITIIFLVNLNECINHLKYLSVGQL